MQQDKPRVFLALTALEEFWDTSRPLLFLGEWCRAPQKKHVLEGLDATVLQSEELSYADSYEAYQHATTVYEKLLPKLATWLNQFHGTQHSLNYWRLLIGPFFCSEIFSWAFLSHSGTKQFACQKLYFGIKKI